MGRFVPERSAGKMPAAPYASPPSTAEQIRNAGLFSLVPSGLTGRLNTDPADPAGQIDSVLPLFDAFVIRERASELRQESDAQIQTDRQTVPGIEARCRGSRR